MIITASRPRRPLLCLLVAATIATVAFAATASAAATPVSFYRQFPPNVSPADPQPCTGSLSGTLTNTVTVQGHRVDNADGTFHIFEYVTQNVREDWTDGTYLIARIVGPASFNMNATGDWTFSGAQQDRGTLYSPTGQILGSFDIATEFHETFVNGAPTSVTGQFRIIRSPC